jgi:hypothetical protein
MQFGAACDFSRPLLPLLGTSASMKSGGRGSKRMEVLKSGTPSIPPSESQVPRNQVMGFRRSRSTPFCDVHYYKTTDSRCQRCLVRHGAAVRPRSGACKWKAGRSTANVKIQVQLG